MNQVRLTRGESYGRQYNCGLPAAVEDSYTLGSTDGPVASVKIQCPAGHWFNGPVAALTVHTDAAPTPGTPVAVPARGSPR